ncbi:YczE/YyaS/YitT family protein [Niameybacter sp.]|uniref:YczE/YyaS/YitT family protein n=1 Tax=Niameybacter sp. TaxID=2033640 RepID=UPI002FCA9F99
MKKLIVFFGGLFVLHLGVAMLLELNLGSDPFTLFTQGIATALHITPGWANRLIACLFLGILFIFNRKSIKIGTFLCMIFVGFAIDINLLLIAPLQLHSYGSIVRIVLFMVACGIIGIGFPILKCADLGIPPNDLMYFMFMEKLNKPYGKVRMVCDGLLTIVGIFFGGIVGVGTIICILLIGPIVQFCMPKVEKVLQPFLQG